MSAAPPSLRRQLALGLSLAITLLWLLAITGAAYVVRHELDEVFDSALQETGERILPLAVLELFDTDNDGAARRVNRVAGHEEFLTYVVRDAVGTILLHSHDADLSIFGPPQGEGFYTTATHRIFTRSAVSGAYVIDVAEPLAHRSEAVRRAVLALILPVFLLVPLGLVLIFWIVRRALRPVERLRAEVTARDGGDLRAVSTDHLPSELTSIARAVNQLLSRLTRTLEAERSFTANAAHELRTPIAAGLAQTQRLIAEAPKGDLADRARRIEAQLQRLARLSEKLMQLARAEGGGVLADAAQDPAPVLAIVAEDFRRAGQGARLQLALPPNGAAPLRMDPDAFAILVRNLIENALRHGDAAQPVSVSMAPDGTLRVVNGGGVVSPERLAQLTKRFTRGDSRAEGAGLGLAIADTIARNAGMRLQLLSP
ncbi:MAG: histidine kinase dimerization/phospho-acceptor domain-containing protein, partial [Paracoccaceae bacterium]|nr:histidine kinase dimerization/phospho-acceptor domain-containing protein [Paracoccaceae bacterium]